MDRAQLADFLRRRREVLQPEDVGLRRGSRRRTAGLRREEVAALCDMSVDYYSRLEQSRGPQPSEQMLTAMARGLRLTLDERDHLFRLAGHTAPARALRGDHVSPGIMRVLDRLADTPAQVMTELGETLAQTPAARALFGDETRFEGFMRSVAYRWFMDPSARDVYPVEDHPMHSRAFTADIRTVSAKHGARSRAGAIVDALLVESPEFAQLWEAHDVRSTHPLEKRVQHPEVGVMELQCQFLIDPDQGQTLLVLTATPGTESYDLLQLLSVIGTQSLESGDVTR
ncbi:Helix-turn-helix domain-containing protein [Microbacterium sp. cf046]|uniref:helix-turn-helix transcriptional regulator n=1 Tax=Microbacterium sp. cf046 TaxID=1761803 RepID=UPI0008F0D267|nr:helix-turn-helix transcriptional regulator [Microbacterium sp. cf046]SFS07374.1 Helix-turn-helix domain-containing protein [Microbacterium sp. cf046]